MTDEPDNVVPMRGHTHECSSCHAQIVTERLYEGHTDTCMQPEIRMRRAEARILELINAVNVQTELIETASLTVVRLEQTIEKLDKYCGQLHAEFCAPVGAILRRHNERLVALEKDHGKPQDTEPDTKRSGYTGIHDRIGPGESCSACYFGRPHTDASAAEPPGEAPAGAEPAAGGPERPG